MKNLNYCVSLVQMDLDDYTTHRQQKYLQYAIMGYRELKLRANNNVAVAYLTPNAVMNAVLPKDFAYYTKVGINVGGQIITLSVNKDIVVEDRYDDCGNPYSSALQAAEACSVEDIAGRYNGGYYYAPHYRNGQFVGEMYGVGGGFNDMGYFKINTDLNLIQFSREVPRVEIILEYASDASSVNGGTLIPTIIADTIRNFIHWQMVEYDNSVSLNEKYNAYGRFNASFQKYKEILLTPTVEEYLDASWSTTSSSVKR